MTDPAPKRPSAAFSWRGHRQRTGEAGSAAVAWATLSLAITISIAGCSSTPAQPDWKLNAQSALERGTSAWLEGRSAIAEREFGIARSEIARTGRPDLLARAELARCAAHVASLQFDPCSAFEALRNDAAPAERAYAAYLAGRASAADIALLPEHHRAAASAASETATVSSLQAMKDPLARQITAGVLLQAGRASPGVIAAAIDNASVQGWRRPLLAWLKVQEQRAQAAGDAVALDTIKRRIALVESSAPPRP
jgi:hypothetical protein